MVRKLKQSIIKIAKDPRVIKLVMKEIFSGADCYDLFESSAWEDLDQDLKTIIFGYCEKCEAGIKHNDNHYGESIESDMEAVQLLIMTVENNLINMINTYEEN